MTLSATEARKLLDEAIVAECDRRTAKHRALLSAPPEILAAQLYRWAENPIEFVDDNAWVPDPQKVFGTAPDGVTPKGMIPFLITPKHEELFSTWHATLDAPSKCDCALDKTRQGACTSGFLWAVAIHGFLFRPSTTGLLGSYSDDVIDKGGKGQRDPTSLFGRLRMFLDSFFWNFSVLQRDGSRISNLAFTKPRGRKKQRGSDDIGLAGMPDSDDINYKLTRPRWFLPGFGELFPGAEGNWLQGARPGDSFGRSYSATWALLDEVDHYAKNIREGADRDAWGAVNQNVRCRFLIGTPYKHGTANSLLREIAHSVQTPYRKVIHFDWCDLPFYMLGASWLCRCGYRNPLGTQDSPGAGRMDRTCEACGRPERLSRFDITSTWLEEAKARLLGDKNAEAAEIYRDWEGVRTDRFFSTFDAKDALKAGGKPLSVGPVMFDGFDPGHSSTYPAAFMAVAFDRVTAKPRVVGYWMASGTLIEWWVPFFKRWHSSALERMHVTYGQKKGWPWLDVFTYPPAAREMLDRLSAYAPAHTNNDLYGDTSGSKRMMVESPYEVLEGYKVFVNHRYTADRELLCQKGVAWAAALEIDPDIALVRPPSPDGKGYPSLLDVFSGAKTVNISQGEKIDVDAKEPAFVKNACDAWFYLCRGLDEGTQRAVAVPDEYGVGWETAEPAPTREVYYGADDGF